MPICDSVFSYMATLCSLTWLKCY
uniref:Uncharacterized protein n=1 Tax=Salix viminalis TaxID=40686 RepID=A0A6N2N7N3_SALVM